MLAVVTLSYTAGAKAAEVPKLVRIVVPSAPGGGTDILARVVGQQLAKRLKTTVIIENRAGASGLIGTAAVASGPTDGSMILIYSSSLMTTAATVRRMPLDVNRDLTAVAVIADGPLAIGVPSTSKIHTPAEFIAATRAKPEGLAHGSAGVGTTGHVAGELLASLANVPLRHIPYKGAAPASLDLASGVLDAMFSNRSSLGAQVAGGRVRYVAVTSSQPSAAYPGVPTMASVVPGYSVSLWYAAWLRAGTPREIVELYNRELNEISKSKEVMEVLQADGSEPLSLTPDESARKAREAFILWKKLATEKNIVVD